MDWLACDFGPQLGDNFRGLLLLKALARRHPQVRLHLWVTPELMASIGGLIEGLGFLAGLVVRPRSVQESYRLCFETIKGLLAAGRRFTLDELGPGLGPDGRRYHKLLPTCEPWFSAKLLAGAELEGPDVINQGEFLAGMLGLDEAEVREAGPLFGEHLPAGGHLCLGLCRPSRDDPKQPAPSRLGRVWEAALASGRDLYALDRQDWLEPPPSQRVHDMRMLPLEDKVALLNRARLFIGIDGGLNHFAAACGCPTLSFYGPPHGGKPAGPLVGPWPRATRRGEHRFFGDFGQYLEAVARAAA